MGNMMTPAMTSTLSSLPPKRSGIGSAVADTFLNIGSSLGFAVNGAIMNRFYRLAIMKQFPELGIPDDLVTMVLSSVQNALVAAQQLSAEKATQLIQISRNSFVHGMDIALLVISGTLLLASILAIILIPVSIVVENQRE